MLKLRTKVIFLLTSLVLVFAAIYLVRLRSVHNPAAIAKEVVQHIATGDWDSLAKRVHPEKGVLFSPCAYVEPKERIAMKPSEVANLTFDKRIRNWGPQIVEEGDILLSFSDYIKEHLYNLPYNSVEPGKLNEYIRNSQVMSNIDSGVFSDEFIFYEFHVPDNISSQGSWGSLRVVLEKVEQRWFLVGLVNDGMSI